MKAIHCGTGDGCYMMVPDDVKAVWDLMVAANEWTIHVANDRYYKETKSCYVDVFQNEDQHDEIRVVDMCTNLSWPEARRLFIEWVRNGCEPGRVGYD